MQSFDLNHLDSNSFEHLVNALALKVLGNGLSILGPGPDGGRDGFFEGEAPYPSTTEKWKGTWYIQSKFHAPSLSKDHHAWLIDQAKNELNEFFKPDTARALPDIWILATNIDPSGVAETGSFDQIRSLVMKRKPKLGAKFHIWGGRKIVELLSQYPNIAQRYGHFITPGNVLAGLAENLADQRASLESIMRWFIVTGLDDQKYAKLEQAGSTSDSRPGVHRLFVDLPFQSAKSKCSGMAARQLLKASYENHSATGESVADEQWDDWRFHPSRAPVWFIKGGPGQGKSTVGQLLCQIQRAALLTQSKLFAVARDVSVLAEEIKTYSQELGLWTSTQRVPIFLELKNYAQWYGEQAPNSPTGIVSHLASKIGISLQQDVSVGTLRRLLKRHSWFVVFDGLDEVPSAIKDDIANEVRRFIHEETCEGDFQILFTSRPQGYSGQFDSIRHCAVELLPLKPDLAVTCARKLIKLDRSVSDADQLCQILDESIKSDTVRELMTTPLQAHILAVIVRGGQRPPERKWELYRKFYDVIKERETNRNLPDRALADLFRRESALIKAIHNRLGFVLHSLAETSSGARATLDKIKFRRLIELVVEERKEGDNARLVDKLVAATTERLVLINTPDDGNHVRFDVRQLQEFFAAEYIYDGTDTAQLEERLLVISGGQHWREVMHFVLSALIETNRKTDLKIAVDVLRRLDDGADDGSEERSLRRRIAAGTVLSARLLQDGVLEQDKAIRGMFRDRMLPLASTQDEQLLRSVMTLPESASRTWLLEMMFTQIREASHTESLGAAAILWCNLSDSDEMAARFSAVCPALSSHHKRFLLRLLYLRDRFEMPRNWQVLSFIDMLHDQKLVSGVEGHTFVRLLSIMSTNESQWRKVNQLITKRYGDRVAAIVQLYRQPSKRYQEVPVRKFGGIVVSRLEPLPPDEKLRKLSKTLVSSSLSGILKIAASALSFRCLQSRTSYLELLDCIGTSWDALNCLPHWLRIGIPRPFEQAHSPAIIHHSVSGIGDEDFCRHLKNGLVGGVTLHEDLAVSEDGKKTEISDYVDFLKQFPLFGWRIGLYDRPGFARKLSSVIEGYRQAVLAGPDFVYCPDIRMAGFIISGCSGETLERLRSLLFSKITPSRLLEEHSIHGPFTHAFPLCPIRLILPDEGHILVHVYNTIMNIFLFRDGRGYYPFWNEEQHEPDPFFHTGQFVPDISALQSIIENQHAEVNQRGAAICLGMLHQNGGIAFASQHFNVLEACTRVAPIVCEAFIATILVKGAINDIDCKRMASILLSHCNSVDLNHSWWLLSQWREKSGVPVQECVSSIQWVKAVLMM